VVSAVLQWLELQLVASAARRWPAHLRDDVAREWVAELHALGHDAGVSAATRAWRRVRFATSLAVARAPRSDAAPLRVSNRLSPMLAHKGSLVLAPLVVVLATPVLLMPVLMLFGWIVVTPVSVAMFALAHYAAEAVLAAFVGTFLARRFLRRRLGQSVGVVACARATLPMAGGLLVVDGIARSASRVWAGGWSVVIAAGCLTILLPAVAAGAAALSRRGWRVRSVAFAALGAPAVTLSTMYALVLLTRHAPADAGARPLWWLARIVSDPGLSVWYETTTDVSPIESTLRHLSGFAFATVALALAYAIRIARPLAVVAATATSSAIVPERNDRDEIPAVARGPWWHRTALACAAYSVVAWAVTLTYLTPNIGVQSSWPSRITSDGRVLPVQPAGWPGWTSEEGRLWMQELQLSCIVVAALCLLCAAAYRGRPLIPTLAGSATLLAVDMTVVRAGWTTPRLLVWLAAGGLIVGMAAWWTSTRPRTNRHRERDRRRLVITITVLAAFLVPGSFFPRIYVSEGVQTPPVVLLVVVGLPTILTIIAAMGVSAASNRPSRGPAWQLPTGLALLPAIGGVLYFRNNSFLDYIGQTPLQFLIFMGPLVLAVPVAAWTISALRDRPLTARRLGPRLLIIPLLFLAGLAAAYATIMASILVARLFLFPMEYGQTYDGLPYTPGAVILGLLLGYVTAIRLDPARPNPATTLAAGVAFTSEPIQNKAT
jgi:hypothetical protein